LAESSNLVLKNSTINKSFAQYGSIFYLEENYAGFLAIENCFFYLNSAVFDLIHFGQTFLKIKNCSFSNNTNTLFYLLFSHFELFDSVVQNHACLRDFPGCLIYSNDNSVISINLSFFENIISEKEEGTIYLETSKIIISYITMSSLKTIKKQGSCISNYNSTLDIFSSEFDSYDINCLYSFQSIITINQSLFHNNISSESNKINYYGTFYCSSCKKVSIIKSKFVGNSNSFDGSAIYIIAQINDILLESEILYSYFSQNLAEESGTIYIYNQNVSIQSNLFEKNFAKRGAGVFCDNDGLKN